MGAYEQWHLDIALTSGGLLSWTDTAACTYDVFVSTTPYFTLAAPGHSTPFRARSPKRPDDRGLRGKRRARPGRDRGGNRLDGFVFAATSGEETTATIGANPDTGVDPSPVALVGVALLTVGETDGAHPAVVGHDAIQWAPEQLGTDAPRTIEDHDEGP